ncbi:hypothetical protein Aple_100510 [Acrocarpospora pleiomorpha]|uniref:Uncharacterized protein n=1 Tax=Acrocarpospora pleiomorpha TaxID=90975 RepID=A0A5M3Y1G0_9ACTN|nr:hypothetical protein [Acrocarpospora pleiomorpha]GES27152.1 hypothetical protein Aple_100510 [Acrocarpospora pleiomorpha]
MASRPTLEPAMDWPPGALASGLGSGSAADPGPKPDAFQEEITNKIIRYCQLR